MKKTNKGMLSHFAGSSKHKRKYTDKQIQDMRKRRLAGESYRSIGATYGVHGASIHSAIKRHAPIVADTTIPKGYIHVTKFCDEHNLEYNTVMYHIRKKNLPVLKVKNKIYLDINTTITNNKFISNNKIEKIVDLKNKGLNITQIAKHLSLNRATVSYYAKQH